MGDIGHDHHEFVLRRFEGIALLVYDIGQRHPVLAPWIDIFQESVEHSLYKLEDSSDHRLAPEAHFFATVERNGWLNGIPGDDPIGPRGAPRWMNRRDERDCCMNKSWSIAEAKAKFSEVIDLARSQGPQTVTRNGRTAVVIVAADEWERKNKRRGNLADFFAASPLRGSQLEVRRLKDRPRKVDL
jgi:prevent-host-death family protein